MTAVTGSTLAQAWPSKTIRIVYPYAGGGVGGWRTPAPIIAEPMIGGTGWNPD
jgi:tripartite-type tricarboxylate transporter receptor subunit TctC